MSPQRFSVLPFMMLVLQPGHHGHTCNSSAQEAWAGGSGVQNQSGLQRTYSKQTLDPRPVYS